MPYEAPRSIVTTLLRALAGLVVTGTLAVVGAITLTGNQTNNGTLTVSGTSTDQTAKVVTATNTRALSVQDGNGHELLNANTVSDLVTISSTVNAPSSSLFRVQNNTNSVTYMEVSATNVGIQGVSNMSQITLGKTTDNGNNLLLRGDNAFVSSESNKALLLFAPGGNNALYFNVGNVNRMVINASGQASFGHISPNARFSISQRGATANIFEVNDGDTSGVYTARYLTVSSTSTIAFKRFEASAHAAGVGLKLPTFAGTPSSVTGTTEGDLVWDSTGDRLYAYTGSAFTAVGGSSFVNLANSASSTSVLAGGGTAYASLGGTIYASSTEVGNIGGGEDDLMTYTLPANTLARNNSYIEIETGFFIDAVGSNKTVKCYFGSTTFYDSGAQAVGSNTWIQIRAVIMRIGATSQIATSQVVSSNTSNMLTRADTTAMSETLSNNLTVKCTGTSSGASTNAVLQKLMTIKWYNTP